MILYLRSGPYALIVDSKTKTALLSVPIRPVVNALQLEGKSFVIFRDRLG
jgi:hypothetical protein